MVPIQGTKEDRVSRKPLIGRRAFLAGAPLAAAALPSPDQGATKPKRLSTSYPGAQLYDESERAEVNAALESRSLFRWYGPSTPTKVNNFEKDLARYMGAKYALAVTSGTAALHVALTALGAGPGDEVVLPAWGWYACYNAILMTGALPVFAETDESLNLDADDFAAKITPRTKAVMVLHLAGCPADMDRILAVARKHKIRVLEDAAQSVGAVYKGKRVAAIGDIGIFSFQISKTITAGEGGAVLTNDPLLFERATRFHDLGMLRPGHKELLGAATMESFVGVNYRMNEMTGAVLGAQLRKLDGILERLRRNARRVRDEIHDLPGLAPRRLPDPEGEIGLGIHLLLPGKQARDRFVAAMRAQGAAASPPGGSLHLPAVPYIEQKVAVHPAWPSFQTPHGKAMRYGAGCCPRTAAIFDRVAVIPIGVRDTAADLTALASAIRKAHQAV
jgi:8-amino-3,8-dideoxy-alpha-D-manno-octulosonate transaminase